MSLGCPKNYSIVAQVGTQGDQQGLILNFSVPTSGDSPVASPRRFGSPTAMHTGILPPKKKKQTNILCGSADGAFITWRWGQLLTGASRINTLIGSWFLKGPGKSGDNFSNFCPAPN